MKTIYKDRPVELEIELGRHSACDSYIMAGHYTDCAMEDLNDAELDDLNELMQDEICEADMNFYGYFRD